MNDKIEDLKKELLKLICDDPLLMSLLYDIGMMPEQLKEGSLDYAKMMVICGHWMEVLKRERKAK